MPEPRSTQEIGSYYIHQIPLGYYTFKGNSGVPTGQRKFDLVGV